MSSRWKTPCLLPWLGASLLAAEIQPPQVPENLRLPETEIVQLKVAGIGKQIYACRENSQTPGLFEWVLQRPQADLINERGEKVGKHYQGPTWESIDGSRVVGELREQAAAPREGSIPWLLLRAKMTQGTGNLGRISYIQRVETIGGAAPAEGCDAAHAGHQVAIDYRAEYYFYTTRE